MAPTLRTKAPSQAQGPVLQPVVQRAEPQETPDGHVQTIQDLSSSSQVQAQPPPQAPRLALVPGGPPPLLPPPPPEVLMPAEAVQQLIQLLQRQEFVNQARTFHFTQLEDQIAELRGRQIADQGSPE